MNAGMRQWVLSLTVFLLVLCAAVHRTYAQVEISCTLPHARYLVYQPVVATVSIRNLSARPIVLGGADQNARLYFEIRDYSGYVVQTLHSPDFSDFVIDGRSRTANKINITAYYDLRNSGIYSVHARLDWKDTTFKTEKIFFEVCNGSVMAKRITDDGTGRWLIHSLVMLHRRHGATAFMRIEDDTYCYTVTELGPFLSLFDPQMIIDDDATVHTLYQSTPTTYTRVVFSADGQWLATDPLERPAGNPEMQLLPSGAVHVDGLDDDYTDDTWNEDF